MIKEIIFFKLDYLLQICPPLKKVYASQQGETPFGAFREHSAHVREHVSRSRDTRLQFA